jgi:hypothetical protein
MEAKKDGRQAKRTTCKKVAPRCKGIEVMGLEIIVTELPQGGENWIEIYERKERKSHEKRTR